MRKITMPLLASAALACGPATGPVAEAAIFAADDLMSMAPDSLDPHLGGEWETGGRVRDSISGDVLGLLETTTGLPVALPEMVAGSDAPIAVLYLFRPDELAGDTVRVRGGWIGFSNGEGSGSEYQYLLDCPRSCALVTRTGPRPVS